MRDTDARANGNEQIRRIGFPCACHRADGVLQNAARKPFPTGMGDSNRAMHGVGEKHGQTIGEKQRQQNAGGIGNKGVDAGQSVSVNRRAASGKGGVHAGDLRAVHLLGTNHGGKFKPRSPRDAGAILHNRVALVADVQAGIQRGERALAYAARAVRKAVRKPRHIKRVGPPKRNRFGKSHNPL